MSAGQALQAEGLHAFAMDDETAAAQLFEAALAEWMPEDERAQTLVFLAFVTPVDGDVTSASTQKIIVLTDQALDLLLGSGYQLLDHVHLIAMFRSFDFASVMHAADLSDARRYEDAAGYLRPILYRYDSLDLNPLVNCMKHFIDMSCLVADALGDKQAIKDAEYFYSRLSSTVHADALGMYSEAGFESYRKAGESITIARGSARGATAVEARGPAAGWHRDPAGRHQLRYWSGESWTEHVADDGQNGVDRI